MKRYTLLSQLQLIHFTYFTDFPMLKVGHITYDGIIHFSVFLVDHHGNVHYYDFSPDSDGNYSLDDYLTMNKEILDLSKN